jgi:hypothetical protein
MYNTREKVDLIRLLCLNEDYLALVAFLGREDLVCFCGGDGEGAGDGGEFGFFDEAVSPLINIFLRKRKGEERV